MRLKKTAKNRIKIAINNVEHFFWRLRQIFCFHKERKHKRTFYGHCEVSEIYCTRCGLVIDSHTSSIAFNYGIDLDSMRESWRAISKKFKRRG